MIDTDPADYFSVITNASDFRSGGRVAMFGRLAAMFDWLQRCEIGNDVSHRIADVPGKLLST